MNTTPTLPRPVIAVAQLRMHWTVAGNLAALRRAIDVAADAGADVLVTCELAVTGFHREIGREAEPARVGAAVDEIRQAAAARAIAVVLGAPTQGAQGRPCSSHVHIDARGRIVAVVSKIGLTPSEATFFAPGETRPLARLGGVACTSVLCREVEDLEPVAEGLADASPDIVFWPSFIGRPDTEPEDAQESRYLPATLRLAARLGSHVVQANWPNSLNAPGTLHMGESAVVAPDGELLFRLPRDGCGVAVFALGDRHWRWLPEASAG